MQRDKTYDRIVISEDLEQYASSDHEQMDNFIFGRLDSISDEASNVKGEDIPIILICEERRVKGEELLVKLFGIGIYNAIIGADRSINEVCRLINRPRSKKEAKIYYKIDSEDVLYEKNDENEVSELEIQNILAHYKKIGNDENNPYNDSNKIYAVVKYETNSNEQFINAWNSLGIYDEKDCCIYTVIMNMHGNESEISNGVGKGYSFKLNTSDIESLKKKPVQRLVLLQCSVGKISSAGKNIASSFARVVSGRVLAGDAEVNNNIIEYTDMWQFPDEDNFTSIDKGTYMRYYVKEESNGWFIYKYDWNERKIKYEYMAEAVKKFRIYQLLAFFD